MFTPVSGKAATKSSALAVLALAVTLLFFDLLQARGIVAAVPQDGLPFTDVQPSDWYYPHVLALVEMGAISGYPDNTFRPNYTATRAQFTKILVTAFGLDAQIPSDPTFSDIPAGSTFFQVIEIATAHGMIGGYNCGGPGEPCDSQGRPYFRPGANVTRGQAAKMVVQASGWAIYSPPSPVYADVPLSSSFYTFVNTASAMNVIAGYPCGAPQEPCNDQSRPYFRAQNSTTRAQTAKMINLSRLLLGSQTTPTATPPAGSSPATSDTPSPTPTNGPAGTSSPAPPRSNTPTTSRTPTFTSTPVRTASATSTGQPAGTSSPTATWTIIPGGSGVTANDPIPCPLWPADNIWNRRVDTLPTMPASDSYVQTIGAGNYLSNGFASHMWQNSSIGNPYDVVPTSQPRVVITFTQYPGNSDPGPYPFPTYAIIEGSTYLTPVPSTGDRHASILRAGDCTLYETWHSLPNIDGSWSAGNGAVFNLLSNQLRPDGWTSADAAGFAVLPGLVRYDEVASGQITHAVRFTADSSAIHNTHTWPARHTDGTSSSVQAPPMGTRFRLKASVDISVYPPRIRTILQGLKTYGMFLGDSGDPWQMDGAPDQRWDDVELQLLHSILGSDFEAVDMSGLMIDPNSGQSR